MSEVKACPFCGSAAKVGDYRESTDETGEVEGYASVECSGSECRTKGFVAKHYDTLEEAIAAWNTRTPDYRAIADQCAAALEDAHGALGYYDKCQTGEWKFNATERMKWIMAKVEAALAAHSAATKETR